MSYMLHVGTYLMGTARFQSALYQRYVAEALYHAPVRHSLLANTRFGRHHSHAQSVLRVASNVALNASFVLCEVAPHHSVVRAMRSLIEELQSERRLCFRSFCHNEQSACVLVDTVHESHFGVVGVVALHIAHVPGYGIDQCAGEVARSRVHHHASLLVHHHQVVVLIHHVYGQVFSHDACVVAWAVEHQRHHVARAHLEVALDGASVDVYKACIGSRLNTVARRVRQFLAHIFVDSQGLHAGIGLKSEVLVQLPGLVVRRISVIAFYSHVLHVKFVHYIYIVCHILNYVEF